MEREGKMDTKQLLRGIPKVDEVLKLPGLEEGAFPAATVREAVRAVLDELRRGVLAG